LQPALVAVLRAATIAVLFALPPALSLTRVSAQSAPTGPARGAAASEPPGYQGLIDEAILEYRSRHFEEARALFTRAHQQLPNARALRGIGMADFELRDYADSVTHLRAALDSQVKPLRGQLREETEALAARAENFVGRVELSVQPASSEVTLDGAPVASGEKLLLLEVGDHVLEFHATGYAPERRPIKVRGGERQKMEVDLVQAVAEASSAAEPPARPAGLPGAPRSSRERERERDDRTPLYRNAWLWTGVGVLVAGAAIGAGLYFRPERPAADPIVRTTLREDEGP
jgi:hypothetical protein